MRLTALQPLGKAIYRQHILPGALHVLQYNRPCGNFFIACYYNESLEATYKKLTACF
jgi:hypothetical protein